jgi:hypothetical protein
MYISPIMYEYIILCKGYFAFCIYYSTQVAQHTLCTRHPNINIIYTFRERHFFIYLEHICNEKHLYSTSTMYIISRFHIAMYNIILATRHVYSRHTCFIMLCDVMDVFNFQFFFLNMILSYYFDFCNDYTFIYTNIFIFIVYVICTILYEHCIFNDCLEILYIQAQIQREAMGARAPPVI